jgi:hypothetical protein
MNEAIDNFLEDEESIDRYADLLGELSSLSSINA